MSREQQKMTIEAYRQYTGRDPLDVDGNLINIGDEVELREEYYAKKGDIGIVRCYYISGQDFGVEFLLPRSGLHNLDGLITTSLGLYVSSKQIRLIKTSIPVDEETHIKNLIEDAKTEPKLALIDGKFYRLSLEPKGTANTFTETLMSAVSRRVSQIRAEANIKVQATEEKLRQAIVVPNVTIEEAKKGMTIYKNGSCLVYQLPLHYAPKFIGAGKTKQVTDEISLEHQKELEQDVLLEVQVNKSGKVELIGTRKPNFEAFPHYHGNLANCVGTVNIPEIKTPADVFVFRDKLQEALTIVNWQSLYSEDPSGMPTINKLREAAKHIKREEAWGDTDIIKIGSIVKILAEHDSSKDLTGLIGKVVGLYETWASVEFIASKSFMHAGHDGTGKKGYCYDFPESKLQLMPPGTRRTRRVASPTTTTWVDEEDAETIAPTFDSAEDEEFAKFGVRGEAIRSDSLDAICRRCGRPRGEHYNSRNPSICHDEHMAGRQSNSLGIRVARTWAGELYREVVTA